VTLSGGGLQQSSSGIASPRPLLIVAALLLASFVVGLDTRVFAVGLLDLRGPFGLSADQASWLNTIANAPQILVSSAVAWWATVFGIRRIMIPSTIIYAAISLIIPLVHVSEIVFLLHGLRALLLGVFLPATVMVIFRNLEPRYWLIGIGLYTLRVPLAQYLGVVLVGLYGDHLGWQWLYWQDVIVTPIITILLIVGAPRENIDIGLLERADWGGMLLLGSAMTVLYIALDQGNRLNWLESGLIFSLLMAGVLLTVTFFANESLVNHPWAHASVILTKNIGVGFAVIIVFAVSAAGASIAIPSFNQNVSGLRPSALSEIYLFGGVAPVLVSMFLAVKLHRRVDARLCIVAGFVAMALGSLIGTQVTISWSPWSFLPVVLLNGIGQTFAFFATVLYLISNSDPRRSTAVSAYIQVVRLVGVEFAGSLLNTWLRYREQFHSNILGQSISSSSQMLESRLEKLHSVFRQTTSWEDEALRHLDALVRSQAYVLTYADSFLISFWFAVTALLLVALLSPAPFGPLHPRYEFE
jgi:DHA2 family multidrug resistance protein